MKKILIIDILILSLLLSGCTNKTENVSVDWGLNSSSESISYQNYYLSNGTLTQCQSGYYYSKKGSIGFNIYYFDSTTLKSTILCNQANCKHNEDTCPSYIESDGNLSIQYYGGYIYYVKGNGNNSEDKVLCRMSETGTNKQEIMTLCTQDEGIEAKIWLNDHYLVYYILDEKATTYQIYVLDMNTNIKKNITAITGRGLEDIKFWNNGMVIYSGNTSTNDETYHTNYYVYNYSSEKLCKISVDQGVGFTVDDNILYYDDKNIIRRYDLDENAQLDDFITHDDYYVKLSYDSKYIYVYKFEGTDKWITVYNKEGSIVDQITLDFTNIVCEFGGENTLFLNIYNKSTSQEELYYYDKSQIGTVDGEWIKVEEEE